MNRKNLFLVSGRDRCFFSLSSSRTIFRLFFMALFVWCSRSPAITAGQADTAIRAFNTVYWNASNKTFYNLDNKTGLLSFWMYAHAWETEMDAYERTHDTAYLHKIQDAYTGFNATNGMGTTWSNNVYNDDIMWWVLASTRAYSLTMDTNYRAVAKRNFDWVYSTQCDTVLGGGIWWRNDTHGSKNACINCPAAIAAVNLYRITGDHGYLDKATALHLWVRTKLYLAGRVRDNINTSKQVSNVAFTYNQGCYIGAAYGLFRETGDSVYFREALQTADYTRQNMCITPGGILVDESATSDLATFKTVFVHHMMRLIIDGRQSQYLAWMTTNADAVWRNRRSSDNCMWSCWNTAAPASGIQAQGATGGVALLNMIVIANTSTGITCPPNVKPVVSSPSVRHESRSVLLNGRTLRRSAIGVSGMLVAQSPEGSTGKHMIFRGIKTGEK
jgi:predicted alpha-1,6-mannanase (GH76 family)